MSVAPRRRSARLQPPQSAIWAACGVDYAPASPDGRQLPRCPPCRRSTARPGAPPWPASGTACTGHPPCRTPAAAGGAAAGMQRAAHHEETAGQQDSLWRVQADTLACGQAARAEQQHRLQLWSPYVAAAQMRRCVNCLSCVSKLRGIPGCAGEGRGEMAGKEWKAPHHCYVVVCSVRKVSQYLGNAGLAPQVVHQLDLQYSVMVQMTEGTHRQLPRRQALEGRREPAARGCARSPPAASCVLPVSSSCPCCTA